MLHRARYCYGLSLVHTKRWHIDFTYTFSLAFCTRMSTHWHTVPQCPNYCYQHTLVASNAHDLILKIMNVTEVSSRLQIWQISRWWHHGNQLLPVTICCRSKDVHHLQTIQYTYITFTCKAHKSKKLLCAVASNLKTEKWCFQSTFKTVKADIHMS